MNVVESDGLPAADLMGAWLLTGCTASGKSEIAVALAERLGAEILSVDSMAVYRRLAIGVAKPTAEQQARVRHRLINLVEPEADFSIAAYLRAAKEAIAAIRGRGKRLLFVGGTPLYLQALLEGIEAGPPPDEKLRSELTALAAEQGAATVHDQLQSVDPRAAAELHVNDVKRVIRAIEYFRATGKSIRAETTWRREPPPLAAAFLLTRDVAELNRRIERRARRMFDDGLIEEVESLLAEGRSLGKTASQAIGYREALGYLRGEHGLNEAIESTMVRSRRLAKRQRTWFRGMPFLRSVAIAEETSPASAAAMLYDAAATYNEN